MQPLTSSHFLSTLNLLSYRYHEGMDVWVIVIGKRHQLRNQDLQLLETVTKKLSYVSPVYLEEESGFDDRYDEKMAKLTLGRGLLAAEIGCVMAHGNAAIEARSKFLEFSELKWCLLLEDDADLSPQSFSLICDQLKESRTEGPGLINFFRDPFLQVLWKSGSPTLVRLPYKSPIAACYAISRSAAELISSSASGPISFVADWPPFVEKVKTRSSTIGISDVGAESTIGRRSVQNPQFRASLILTQIRNIRKLSTFYNLTHSQVALSLIIRPLIRDTCYLLARLFQVR